MVIEEEEEEEIAESPKSFRSLGSWVFYSLFYDRPHHSLRKISFSEFGESPTLFGSRPLLPLLLPSPLFKMCLFFLPFPTGKKKVESGSRGRDKRGTFWALEKKRGRIFFELHPG